jgi:DNA-directed RNA polymerase alpha subunit
MAKTRSRKITQKEFPFASSEIGNFLADPPRPADLGKLPVAVLRLSPRAVKWLRVHHIDNLDQLVQAHKEKIVSRQLLDNEIRKELQRNLKNFWNGSKYRYIFALNFLDRGVALVLSRARLRAHPIERLELSHYLRKLIQQKGVKDVGQLLLQPELKWRNPRLLGNIPVDEILVSLSKYITRSARGK